ncbi:unnamed protein product [Tuber aestivum]|uniref:Uncharacterized protein n=1 Tax=Tuber aestivum TaxID=59557 RepID=A0A292Q4U9_9PEZI|nr:unnamed protein product [Tuber aestivum]
MDPTANPSAELESPERDGTTTHTMPPSDQPPPDVTASSSAPAPAHPAKSGSALNEKLKKFFSPHFPPLLAKIRGKGKEKEKNKAADPATVGVPMAQRDDQEEAHATKKGLDTSPKSLLRRMTRSSKK